MTATNFWLTIRFDEPVILSAHSSTAGDHETLDFVPGSALLGAVARSLYHKLGDEDAWTVFHSGKVRFGNAYPLCDDGSTTIPVPLSAHYPKAKPEQAAAGDFFDLSSGIRPKDAGQLEQVRRQYLSGRKHLVRVRSSLSLRTAIEDASGTAKESKLFGYASLPKQSCFAGPVECDADVDDGLVAQIQAILGGQLLLGRSRSAEFGKASTSVHIQVPGATANNVQVAGRTIVFCLSDVCLLDEIGAPAREPQAAHFGFSDGSIVWADSHVRTRLYSPFNAAFRNYETERMVFEKGSVFVIDGVPEIWCPPIKCVGSHCSAGLGRIWIAPPFLGHEMLGQWAAIRLQYPEKSVPYNASASASLPGLIAWRRGGFDSGAGWADKRRETLEALYSNARGLAGARDGVKVGPVARQWGLLTRLAEGYDDVVEFLVAMHERKILGRVDDNTGADIEDPDWGATSQIDGEYVTFASWLVKTLLPTADDAPTSMDEVRALFRLGSAVSKASLGSQSGKEKRA